MSIESFLAEQESSSSAKTKDSLAAALEKHCVSPQEATAALNARHDQLMARRDECIHAVNVLETKGNAFTKFKGVGGALASLQNKPWREVMDYIESNIPTIFNQCYPRRFEMPGGYSSPKRLCVAALHAIWALSRFTPSEEDKKHVAESGPNETPSATHAFKIVSQLTRLAVPTYFVSRPCMLALINTDLPKDFQLQEMPWPMDAMLFVLPDEILQSPDGNITLIAVVRCPARCVFDTPWMNWDNDYLNQRISLSPRQQPDRDTVAILGLTDTCKLYHWECPLDATNINSTPDVWVLAESPVNSELAPTPEEEQFTTTNLSRTAFQIVLAMLACPEMVETGVLVRSAKEKKGKKQSELWRPNFFGRAYRRYDEIVGPGNESGGQRRVHWRRGHFRHQRFGPGCTGIRVLWIKPMLIGKDRLAP